MSSTSLKLRIKVTGYGPVPPKSSNMIMIQTPPPPPAPPIQVTTNSSSSGGLFPSPVRRILTSMVHSSRGSGGGGGTGGVSPLLLPDSEEKVSSMVPSSSYSSSISNGLPPSEATDILVTSMSLQSTVKDLKRELFHILGPASTGRYVRLIYAGRLLTPDSASLHTFFHSSRIQSSHSQEESGGQQQQQKQEEEDEKDDDNSSKSLLFLHKTTHHNSKPTIVLHAVFAPPGVRGGQQAELSLVEEEEEEEEEDDELIMSTRLLSSSIFSRITNRTRNHNNTVVRRGTGIRSDGIILSPSQVDDSDHDDNNDNEVVDEVNEEHGDIEMGHPHTRSPRIRLGFDRLRHESGLSRDEINTLRIYFAPQLNQFIHERQDSDQQSQEENNNNNNNEDPAERARLFRLQMEDAWMETQGPFSEFRLNLNSSNPLLTSSVTTNNLRWYRFGTRGRGETDNDNVMASSPLVRSPSGTTTMWMGTDRDFVWGFFLGFFVGFMMVFWVWLPTVSHKQKLGILTGLCCHLVLKLAQDTSAVEDRTAVVDLMQEISDGY